MKCKDLTISDYVKHDGAIKIVDAVYLYSVSVYDPSKPWGIAKSELVSVDDIEPIKLTSDILVKNGFDKDERSKYFHVYTLNIKGSYDFDICWSSVNGFNYEGDCMLTYVHQLQHLLRLCGIEKELVID